MADTVRLGDNPAVLEATAIERRGDAGERLLLPTDLALRGGDRVALEGPSGSGKSVLLRALVQLDPLTAGRIEWQGRSVSGDLLPAFRRRVAYLPQRPMLDDRPVVEQLEDPWRLATAQGAFFDRARAAAMVAALGREERFLDVDGTHLSGGEGQLLALVRTLLVDPEVLLLDEPTAAMDPETRGRVEDHLESWITDGPGRAWIWVSHDPAQLERLCDRRLRIDGGGLEP